MANYTKTVNFAAKDALISGNPSKVVQGTEIDTEFNNIAVAIATKANSASPTFTGTSTFATVTATGSITTATQLVSTVATGTAPLVVASTTVIDNLNVSALLGATWAAPAAIGSGTPAAATVTDLTVTGNTLIGNASGDTLGFHPAAWTLNNAVTITGTWSDLGTVTTVDINGGTVDGAVIGGSSAAAGTFTTLVGTTSGVFASDITITSGSIVSASGAISFGNENLTTTGSISGAAITGSGVLSIDDTTQSTSTTTGSIHTDGGLGVVKDAYFGGTASIAGNTIIGSTSVTPEARLHLYGSNGSPGTVAAVSNAVLVLENSPGANINFQTSDAGESGLYWGTPTDSNSAFVAASYGSAYLNIGTGYVGGQIKLYGGDSVLNLTLSGASGSELGAFAGTMTTVKGVTLAGTSGNVGIGIAHGSADGTLHVHTATAGSVAANVSADDMVVENSGATGISILSPDASPSAIFFGSPSANVGAYMQWGYDSSSLIVGTGKVGASTVLRGDSNVPNLTLSGASGSELATFAGRLNVMGASVGDYTYYNDVAILAADDGGLTIRSGTADTVGIAFADGTTGNEQYRGRLLYDHATDTMQWGASGDAQLSVTSSVFTVASGVDLTLSEGKVSITDTANEDVLAITANSVTTNNLLNLTGTGLTTGAIIKMTQTTADAPFINFAATADGDATSAISTLTTSGATTHHVQVDINGTKAWIAVSTNNPS